jgi:hypothetical protein
MSNCVSLALLVLLLFRSTVALSSAQEASESPAAAGSANEIPIELRENFPLLVATVDGIDVPLQFDLGNGSALVLQQSVLDLIKAVPTGESSKFQDPMGVFESPMFKVARLQIGTAVFTNVIAQLDVHSPSYQPAQIGQKGFLGTGLLKSYEVVLDYPRRTMTLVPRVSSESSPGTCKGTVVPFSPKWHGEPVTEADTDLGRVMLWWDTGAPTTLLRKTIVQELRSQPAGDTVTTKRFTLGGTDFGPWQFEMWDVTLPGFDGLIGYNFFASHVICIDFPGNRIVISR